MPADLGGGGRHYVGQGLKSLEPEGGLAGPVLEVDGLLR
jgi:hypothetical protein